MTELQTGTQPIAGRYVLRSMIGRGGSGAVWRGEDRQLDRQVAIKQIVLSDQRSTHSRARAMREAQAVAKLRSPGVVQVYDVHDDGAHVYLVMELIDAPSLQRLVRRTGEFEPARAAALGRSVLATLVSVHRAGIVHRDVKPSNVLVGADTVHLTDFGIALFGDDPVLTAAGSVLGTPTYMAPEQARGERAGPATDLYGLGATLYFAVEGQGPFAGIGSWETTQAVRDKPPRAGLRLGPLAPVIDALLAKDPDARPSPDEVDAALAAAEAGRTLSPPRAGARVAATPRSPHADTVGSAPDPAAGDGPRDLSTEGVGNLTPGPRRPSAPRATAADPRDEDRRQLRRLILGGTALLVLLAVALVLLFLAVQGHPAAPAALTSMVVAGTPYHGRDPWNCRSRRWSRSTRCVRSSSPAP